MINCHCLYQQKYVFQITLVNQFHVREDQFFDGRLFIQQTSHVLMQNTNTLLLQQIFQNISSLFVFIHINNIYTKSQSNNNNKNNSDMTAPLAAMLTTRN